MDQPWALDGWEGTTTRAYGVDFIPKSYLVDSKGCILQKDIDTRTLADVLTQRFGESSNFSDSNLDDLDD